MLRKSHPGTRLAYIQASFALGLDKTHTHSHHYHFLPLRTTYRYWCSYSCRLCPNSTDGRTQFPPHFDAGKTSHSHSHSKVEYKSIDSRHSLSSVLKHLFSPLLLLSSLLSLQSSAFTARKLYKLSKMKFFAIILALLVASTLFVAPAEAGKRRIIRKLVKGALVAKLLKPKLLPLPIPIPIPIHTAVHEPVHFSL